jgi:hypothetical protein
MSNIFYVVVREDFTDVLSGGQKNEEVSCG